MPFRVPRCPDDPPPRARMLGVDSHPGPARVLVAPVTDEGFGRQQQLRAPGGPLVKVNELDPGLFG